MTFPFPYIPRYSRNKFWGGDVSFPSLYDMMNSMAARDNDMDVPLVGGNLVINGNACGAYDYVIKQGNQQISAFDAAKWFTNSEDTHSAIIIVRGDLTIDAGQVLIPPVRKLFTALYVTGDLTVTGEISMTARGANHSVAGSNIPAVAIRIVNGTFSGIVDPQIPASGGPGGIGPTGTSFGNDGGDESDGGTGGGGSGGNRFSTGETSGDGAAGTSFSGGPGGGGADDPADGTPTDASPNGGSGGDGAPDSGGGAGNPSGSGQNNPVPQEGTGGTLVIVSVGAFLGSGAVTAKGRNGGGSTNDAGGGASGGGSINVLYGSDVGPSPDASGGVGGDGNFSDGGDGGDGTARKMAL